MQMQPQRHTRDPRATHSRLRRQASRRYGMSLCYDPVQCSYIQRPRPSCTSGGLDRMPLKGDCWPEACLHGSIQGGVTRDGTLDYVRYPPHRESGVTAHVAKDQTPPPPTEGPWSSEQLLQLPFYLFLLPQGQSAFTTGFRVSKDHHGGSPRILPGQGRRQPTPGSTNPLL
jgi:hypothetical protein